MRRERVCGEVQIGDLGSADGQFGVVDAHCWADDEYRAVEAAEQAWQLPQVDRLARVQQHAPRFQVFGGQGQFTGGSGQSKTCTGQSALLISQAQSHRCGSSGRSE